MNPFQTYSKPKTAKEFQSNANHATYERWKADDELRDFDNNKIKAPFDVIANAHTARWVEREYIRLARKARAEESTCS